MCICYNYFRWQMLFQFFVLQEMLLAMFVVDFSGRLLEVVMKFLHFINIFVTT